MYTEQFHDICIPFSVLEQFNDMYATMHIILDIFILVLYKCRVTCVGQIKANRILLSP